MAFVAGLAGGCSGGSASNGTGEAIAPPPPTSGTSANAQAQRAIAEADIIQLVDGRLYAMSKSGTVSIVDASQPGTLALLGQTTLPGQPFEMYLRGSFLVTMSNGAVAPDGHVTSTYQLADSGGGSLVSVVDVSAPSQPAMVASLKVPGEIADSRIVGTVLYLATYENALCYGCGSAPRTMVTTFDVSSPLAIRQVEQVSFESNAPDGYNLPWGSNWKRSIFVTDQRLYIGGHADVDPNDFGTADEGIIDVLDVTDPGGRLGTGARLKVAGAILSRWQLDETDGVLRVISQQGAGRTGNGLRPPEVATFLVASAKDFAPLGHTTIQLPQPEGLRTVRFDRDRAYAITYNQTDPLFVIDLADPNNPKQRGELFMPGFMYYLEPHGDRVIGLGIDRTDTRGSLNVSLFDVSNPDRPQMLARAPFAAPGITEDYAILNSEVSEDQDRIQKAFRVFQDGLVVVPFSAPLPYDSQGSSCDNTGGGVQLVEWKGDTLTKRALLPLPGNPRRAFEQGSAMIAVSDSNVRSFSLADLGIAHETADLTIGSCVPPASPYSYPAGPAGPAGGQPYEGDGPPMACAVAPGALPAGGWPFTLGLGAAALMFARRRRARR